MNKDLPHGRWKYAVSWIKLIRPSIRVYEGKARCSMAGSVNWVRDSENNIKRNLKNEQVQIEDANGRIVYY
jgi:hypothetical protein